MWKPGLDLTANALQIFDQIVHRVASPLDLLRLPYHVGSRFGSSSLNNDKQLTIWISRIQNPAILKEVEEYYVVRITELGRRRHTLVLSDVIIQFGCNCLVGQTVTPVLWVSL